MPTPCPQPRPLTSKVVAVTAAGIVGEGARTARGRGDRERETKTGENEQHPPHGDPTPRLAEQALRPGVLYRTFNTPGALPECVFGGCAQGRPSWWTRVGFPSATGTRS